MENLLIAVLHADRDGQVDERRAHIVQIAQARFLTNGFASTTMDGIAKAAKVSKQTLYRYFRDKAELFEAVVEREMQPFRDPPDLTHDDRPFEDVLFEAACWVYDNHMRWQNIAMNKTLAAAAGEFSELVGRAHQLRTQSSVFWITDYMQSLADRGLLAIPNPVRAAVRFTQLASQGSRSMMGYEMPAHEARGRCARQAVNLFVSGLRAGNGYAAGVGRS